MSVDEKLLWFSLIVSIICIVVGVAIYRGATRR